MNFKSESSKGTNSKDQEGDLVETSDYTASLKMAASSSSRKRRRKLFFDSDSDSDMENIADGGVTTSSRQKKGRESEENGIFAARNNGGSDLEEVTYDQQFAMQRCYNKEEHRDISLSSDSEVERPSPSSGDLTDQEGVAKITVKTPENSPKMVVSTSSRKRQKKLGRYLDSDSDSDKENSVTADDCLTPPSKLGKRRVPLSGQMVNRQQCLQKLKEKRIAAAGKKSSKGSEVANQPIDQLSSMQKYYDEEEHHDISPCTASSDSKQEGGQDDLQNVPVDVTVVESSDDSSCDSSFIDDTEMNSQEIQELDNELMLLKKPTLKQAYNYYLRKSRTKLLCSNSAFETESDLWFEKCKNLLEDTISSKKELVGSTAWCKDFQEMIKSHYALEKKKLRRPLDDLCQACRRSRHLTKCLVFRDKDNRNKVVQKFRVGIYCASRGALVHRLHNHLSVEMEKKCQEKAFKRFQCLLKEADRWAADGDKRREMKAAVSICY